jgi:hypothetical protein
MPIPSKETARKILSTIEAVNNMTGPATQRPRRRVRTGGSGGSTRVLVRLNANSVSTNAGEYAGDIVTQRTSTGNIVTANVTIWAPQVNEGDLPLTGTKSGRFYRADSVANVTDIEDAVSALADPPATIYEIQPSVFLGV